jgi:chromosome segregation protein
MPSRLKSLELHGYKTFASRTLFVYSDKVTAIVGPNGSGKSNIADSLRWVLGEQSYSLLRGKKTEDMIFAGSEHRPRAGMASATITFDNEDGWLPIDFSEVAIARRAYRDGQNEYLINGQRVRLKDVSELLAQSGLAERTYTIIGQGLVDAALALKAEERRRLFEEAAGTGLHRSRREEALRRLETTHRNLERVQDIMAELQPRLRSLERQARRAREYEQVKADLRVLLREWYGYHWHHAQEELVAAREIARQQERGLNSARDNQASLEEELAGLRDRTQGLRASLNSWHRQSSQLHSRREALSRDLAVTEERMRSIQEQLQATRAELVRVAEELALQQERLLTAQQEAQRLTSELEEARTQLSKARDSLGQQQSKRQEAEKALQDARQTLSALNSRHNGLQARLSERIAQAARAEEAFTIANEAVKTAEQNLQDAKSRAEEADLAQYQAKAAREAAENSFRTHRQKLDEVEKSLAQLQEKRGSVLAEQARLNTQLDVLEQAENALTGYGAGTRLLLQASRKERLQGVLGAISSFIDVPAELEIAVTAALGEYLDSILLETDSEEALDLLSKSATRGVLLPIQSLKPFPFNHPSLTEQKDCLGIAADLVSVKPQFRPAVDLLLGNVIVVKDRPAARRILSESWGEDVDQPLCQVRAVTLKGEVFYSSGPVLSAGAGSESGGQTILSRQRQRRELTQKLAEIKKNISDLDARMQKLEAERNDLQAEGSQLNKDQQLARQEEEQESLAANRAHLAVEQAERQVKWQLEQRQRLQHEISRGEAEAAEIRHEIVQLESETTLKREQLREKNATFSALSLEDFQSQVSHWSTQAAVAERALADGKNRQRERENAFERAGRTKSGLQTRAAELEDTLQALDKERAERRQAELKVGEEIEALRVAIEPAEAELENLEQEQAELQKAETSARQALSKAEHHHAQARITLARRQEALVALRNRIEDDFGLVAFEYSEDVSGPTPLPLQGMVEQLPLINQLSPEIEETIKRQRAQLRRMGSVNPEAQSEYQEVKQRFTFMTEQIADLEKADADVRQVIAELDALMEREFRRTFDAVAVEFKEIFTRLFGGGSARLVLTDPDDLTDTGIDIEARLPGRRSQGLSLLSGGERSLTAVALVFSLLKVSPTPFCVLDEVDAMLDEANVGRFRDLLRELSENTQFVVVTHNRNTVQVADVIYGVTMGRDSASQVLSLKLDEVSKLVD